jgi:hypothetical protein
MKNEIGRKEGRERREVKRRRNPPGNIQTGVGREKGREEKRRGEEERKEEDERDG